MIMKNRFAARQLFRHNDFNKKHEPSVSAEGFFIAEKQAFPLEKTTPANYEPYDKNKKALLLLKKTCLLNENKAIMG